MLFTHSGCPRVARADAVGRRARRARPCHSGPLKTFAHIRARAQPRTHTGKKACVWIRRSRWALQAQLCTLERFSHGFSHHSPGFTHPPAPLPLVRRRSPHSRGPQWHAARLLRAPRPLQRR